MVKNKKIGYNLKGHKKSDVAGIIICLIIFLLLIESILQSKNLALLILFTIIALFCIILGIASYCKRK